MTIDQQREFHWDAKKMAQSWQELLQVWNNSIIKSRLREYIDPPIPNIDWLGFEGATVEVIAALESRLARKLPRSYIEFLGYTNGWRGSDYPDIPRLLPIAEVDWWVSKEPQLVNSLIDSVKHSTTPTVPDEEYFVYDHRQALENIRIEYFDKLLLIGDKVASTHTFFLNPEVIHDGEWEAWDFAHWYPGAGRYQSFFDLMSNQCDKIVGELDSQPSLRQPRE